MIDRVPPTPPGSASSGPASILVGIVRLALGRADGLAPFQGTPAAFLSSLAPWLAFLIVGGALRLVGSESPAEVLRDALGAVSGLLAPAVLSHVLASAWGREPAWLRYSVAFNWCQWAIPAALAAALLLLGLAVTSGVPYEAAGIAAMLAFGFYALWLHWFLSRTALGLGKARAAAFVALVNLGTVVLVLGPRLLASQLIRHGISLG